MTGVEMPCTNRDASVLTKKRRGVAEYSYYTNWKAATVNSQTGGNLALSAPARTSAEVVGQIYVGGQTAYAYNNLQVQLGNNSASAAVGFPGAVYDSNVAVYPFNPSSGGADGSTGTS